MFRILVKRFYPFSCFLNLPPFGEIVVITQIGKTLIDLTNLVKSIIVLLSVRFLLFILYSVFNERILLPFLVIAVLVRTRFVDSWPRQLAAGGLKWTRTTDLALIRRAL